MRYAEDFLYSLKKLPERDREIMIMWLVEGKTLKETGNIFGLSASRVRAISMKNLRIINAEFKRKLKAIAFDGLFEKI
jgi:DNA-directed RNA polymerase specialized sigma subunit